MEKAKIAGTQPMAVELTQDKEYWWCACGRSKNQPFCDGSHKGTDFEPMSFTLEQPGKVWLCGCKHTQDQPFCDGAHKQFIAELKK